ncbi:acyl-CoA dehydrogenase family protein, partial [Polymorphospora rubra]|uniref:acyl-CoA dehydrogenase family protein n=1 Tax=Polymorphospora rubra TaxID=338584 RepID=UPI00340DDBC3
MTTTTDPAHDLAVAAGSGRDGVARPRDDAEAIAAAHALAIRWRELGPERDRDRAVPYAELELLSRSGLLAVTVPRAYGGPGVRAGTLTRIFAILSAADTALAQVPQNHFGAVVGGGGGLVAGHGGVFGRRV